jgi:predicted GNAT family N-acyltransferase
MEINQSNSLGEYGPKFAVTHPRGGVFWVRPARFDEIEELHSLIVSEISPHVGPADAMRAVHQRNPVVFWQIETADSGCETARTAGMFALLPLTADGVEALRKGTLNRREPQLELIAPAGSKPAALYVWAIVAKHIGRLSYPVIKRGLGPLYADVPCYAIPITAGGAKAVTDRGFHPVEGTEQGLGGLTLLPVTNFESQVPAVDVVVASGPEHLQMSAFIRGATFGAEQKCPYSEEFDGNDFCAMHLIGFVDREPAASMRVRFFASFAKLERLAVLDRYRRTIVKTAIMDKAIAICRHKGYEKLYGQSQERLVGFYARFGFRPMQKNRSLVFSDHNYVEIERDLDREAESITIDSDPYHIIRPEGRWDLPGVLERSAVRPATNPHA